MIIQLKNFGPIEHFEFDTEKQMHFIFGENNIGKSYAISAVYLILKNWKNSVDYNNLDKGQETVLIEQIKKKINSSKIEIDITEEISDFFSLFIDNSFIEPLEVSFSNSFSSMAKLSNIISKNNFEIILDTFFYSIKTKQDRNTISIININSKGKWLLKPIDKTHYSLTLQMPDARIFYFGDITANINNENETNWVIDFNSIVKDMLRRDLKISEIFFLPASRSGLYNSLNGLSNIIVQVTQLRKRIPNLKFEIPNLSEPISDYFLNISNINTKSYSGEFSYFAKKIEDNVIKGKIYFDRSDKKLYYEPHNLDLSVELTNVSSMISEVAPIVAHLKYIFIKQENNYGDNFLFIEEPEAHLHPKIQVELIKLFVEMAKKGLKIVMTSHSNYMFNKLSNMILAKEIDPEKISVGLMKMGKKGSYIDKDSMKMDTEGIEDDNFSDVAEELYMERLKLYEQTH